MVSTVKVFISSFIVSLATFLAKDSNAHGLHGPHIKQESKRTSEASKPLQSFEAENESNAKELTKNKSGNSLDFNVSSSRSINPTAPNSYTQYLSGDFTDSDGDGMTDVAERKYGFDPNNAASFPQEPLNDLSSAPIPLNDSGIDATYQFSSGSLAISWTDPTDGGTYSLRLNNGVQQIYYGGHSKERAVVDYEKFNLLGNEILTGSFTHYAEDRTFVSSGADFSIDLSTSEIEWHQTGVGDVDNRLTYSFRGFAEDEEQRYRHFLKRVFVIMEERLGPPAETFNVEIVNTGQTTGYFMVIDGGRTFLSDGSFIPRLIVHELIHSWKGRYTFTSNANWNYDPLLSGFEEASAEGMAFDIMHEYVRSYPDDTASIQLLQYKPYQYWASKTSYHDLIKHMRATGGGNFWNPGSGWGARSRYSISATTFQEFVVIEPDFFKEVMQLYYQRINSNPNWRPEKSDLVSMWSSVVPEINGISTQKYLNALPVFNGKNLNQSTYVMLERRPYGISGDQQTVVSYAKPDGDLYWGINKNDATTLASIPDWVDYDPGDDDYYYIDTQSQPFTVDVFSVNGNLVSTYNDATLYDRREDGTATGFGWQIYPQLALENFEFGLYRERITYDNYALHDHNAQEDFYFIGYKNFTQDRFSEYVILIGVDVPEAESVNLSLNGANYQAEVNNGVAVFRSTTWPFDIQGQMVITVTDANEVAHSYQRILLEAGKSAYYQQQFLIIDKNFDGTEDVYQPGLDENTAPTFEMPTLPEAAVDIPLSFSVLATDEENDALTYQALSLPEGALFNAELRTINWTPAEPGTFNFQFSVSDGSLSGQLAVELVVRSHNNPPVFDPVPDISVDTQAYYLLSESGIDAQFEFSVGEMHLSWENPAEGGSYSLQLYNGEQTLFYGGHRAESATLNYQQHGLTGDETLNGRFTHYGADRQWIGYKEPFTISLATLQQVQFSINATDADNDPLTYEVLSLPHGALFDSDSKEFIWIPKTSGHFTASFSVSDGIETSTTNVNIDVNAVVPGAPENQAPEFLEVAAQYVEVGNPLSIRILATDAENDAITYSAVALPDGALFYPQTRLFRWVPRDEGDFTATFKASDGTSESQIEVRITVGERNNAPVIESITPVSVNTQSFYRLNESGIFAQYEFALGEMTFNWANPADGSKYYLNLKSGSETLFFGGHANESATLNYAAKGLNGDEVLTGKFYHYSTQGQHLATFPEFTISLSSVEQVAFIVSASDEEGDTLIFDAVSLPPGASFDTESREFNWIPTTSGSYSATFSVSDGVNESTTTANITVNAVEPENLPPVFNSVPSQTVKAGNSLDFTVLALDPENAELIYQATTLPVGANFNSANRTFSWAPSEAGMYSARFSVSDGVSLDTLSIEIAVTEENSAPVIASISPISVNTQSFYRLNESSIYAQYQYSQGELTFNWSNPTDGSRYILNLKNGSETLFFGGHANESAALNYAAKGLSGNELLTGKFYHYSAQGLYLATLPEFSVALVPSTVSFTLSATDADNDQLTYEALSLPVGAMFDPDSQEFTWLPGAAGTYTASFVVSDGKTTTNTSVSITVIVSTPANMAPEFNAKPSQTTEVGQTLTFSILAIDAENAELTYQATTLPDGAAFDAATQTFSWIPSAEGTYSAGFSVSDGVSQDTLSVEIVVTEGNSAPIFSDISAISVSTQTFYRLNESGIFAQYEFALGEMKLSWANPSDGSRYSLQLYNGDQTLFYGGHHRESATLNYAQHGLTGQETLQGRFTHYSSEGKWLGYMSPFTLSLATAEYVSFTVSASDVDNDLLSYEALSLPNGATFNAETREFDWIPNTTGSYSASFSVSDGKSTNTTSVPIIVVASTPENAAPQFNVTSAQTVEAENALVFTISATDIENAELAYEASALPQGATFNSQTREFNWTSTAVGSYTASFGVSDGVSQDTMDVAITVTKENNAPVLVSDDNIYITVKEYWPLENLNIGAKYSFYNGKVIVEWDRPPENTHYMLELKNGDQTIVSGGHALLGTNVIYEGAGLNGDESLDGVIYHYSDDGELLETFPKFTIELSNVQKVQYTLRVTDADNDALSYEVLNLPLWATFDENSQEFSWLPTRSGRSIASFRVSDGEESIFIPIFIHVTYE